MADFDILLERNEYAAEETAKGTLVNSADNDIHFYRKANAPKYLIC
jgi:hypothetical protein